MDDALVGLSDAIEALRAELTDAIARGKGQPMRFGLEPIELSVQAVITKGANGKLGWKVLEAGASYDTARTQTVTLRLVPLWRTADGSLVPDIAISSIDEAGDVAGPHG